jgi:hypothetical protein
MRQASQEAAEPRKRARNRSAEKPKRSEGERRFDRNRIDNLNEASLL